MKNFHTNVSFTFHTSGPRALYSYILFMLFLWNFSENVYLFFKAIVLLTFTPWILALKWYRKNMPLEKIYFGILWLSKAGKQTFLNSYIVLLWALLTCTIKCSLTGQFTSVTWFLGQKDNVGIQKKKSSPAFSFRVNQNKFFHMICFAYTIS